MYRNSKYSRYRSAGLFGKGEASGEGAAEEKCVTENGAMTYAMAYVKDQTYGQTYPVEEALGKGTLFPELYMPYGKGGK